MLFALALIPVIGLLCFIYFNDKNEKEPFGLLIKLKTELSEKLRHVFAYGRSGGKSRAADACNVDESRGSFGLSDYEVGAA